jgi:hypothetical protein
MWDLKESFLVKHQNFQNISTDSRFRFKKYPTYNDFVNFYSNVG